MSYFSQRIDVVLSLPDVDGLALIAWQLQTFLKFEQILSPDFVMIHDRSVLVSLCPDCYTRVNLQVWRFVQQSTFLGLMKTSLSVLHW